MRNVLWACGAAQEGGSMGGDGVEESIKTIWEKQANRILGLQ